MKALFVRIISGIIYITLLILSLQSIHLLIILCFVFGFISLREFNRLQSKKSVWSYLLFAVLFLVFVYWNDIFKTKKGYNEAIQILHVLNIFVLLFLIKDLFFEKKIPLFFSKHLINIIFYITSGFIFIVMITKYNASYEPNILLGVFILIWVNDTFAFLIGKKFGRQKLFKSISPKKTVEGFLGGLFFSCLCSYFIAQYITILIFNTWLMLAVITSVFGTLGDLVESKYKRQAGVKDSGIIMPGHGGLLDRLDSIIFTAPFVYLFLKVISYVS